RSVPGIIRRSFSFELEDKPGTFLQIANGLSATKYDVQSEVLTQDGEPQLIKDATKVMLVIPTDQGNTVALSFAAAKDGTLSQLSETPDLEVLRSVNRAVLLPLNTLDNIRSIGDSTPPVGGAIASVKRTEDDRVQITSTQAATLEPGNSVKIQGTTHYNGYYLAQKIDDNTFEITAKWVDGDSKDWQLGTWEEIPKEQSGLIFDGIITAAESTSDGKLRITSLNHGLENGDGVQISDTQGLNGTYPVMAIDGNSFTLDVTWQPGKAANVKLESRGISFDGTGDYIDIPALLELKSPSPDYDFGETYSAWIQVPSSMAGEQIIVGQKGQLMQLMLEDSKVVLKIQCSDGFHQIEDPNPVPINQWVHYAGSFSCIHNKTSDGTKTTETMLVLCRNGQRVATKVVPTMPETKSQDQDSDGSSNRKQQSWLPEFLIGGTATSNYFTGKIADVQVWNRVREPQEILDSMYLRLTGKEVGLVGYWRLGAIAEGDQREVVDFSVFGNNGVVHGDGDLFVSAVTLERTLKDEVTQIVKYTNDDLVAVTQRATYEESFEFKLNRSLDPTLDPTLDFTPDPNNVDGNGHKIFEFSYWGKANRNSEKRESFTGVMETFQLKDGWYQASARFTVPEGVKLVRCFELSNVLGNWTTLEIRKHQMQLVSDAITEAKYSDEVNLPTLDDQQVERREAFQKLARYEQEAAALMLRKWQLERASKSGVKHNLKSQIEALQTEVATLQSSYDDEVGKFENYWCKITAKHSGKVIGVEGGKTNDGANVLQWGWQNVDNQKWRFKPVDKPADKPAEYYKIVCKHSATEKVLNVNEPRNRNGGNISLWHSANVDHQKWKREPVDNNSAYKIIAKHSGKVLDVSQGHSADGTNIQQWDWSNVENQKWTIETLEEHCNNNIQDANQKLGNKRTELARAESQLRDINEAQNRLSIVTARLDFVQREMAVLTSGQSGKEPVALEMATLKTDTRKLKTQGALLNFVCPASRITAIETCEGNVQLSYFDDQGKMRQTNFDATADSRGVSSILCKQKIRAENGQ
ncbi:MAG: RICIN domain-containing protein, partial [bacterium]